MQHQTFLAMETRQPLKVLQDQSAITKQTYSHLLKTTSSISNIKEFRLTIPGKDTVREVSNVLSSNECAAIIDATSTASEGFSRPTAFSTDARDCQRIHTVDKAMSSIMMPRLRPFLPEVVGIDGVRWRLHRFTHHWRYVRYFPGGHFSPHYDGVKMTTFPVPGMSIFTVQIYLNGGESFTGGSTRFYPDYKADRSQSHEIEYGHVSKFDPFTDKEARVFSVEPEAGKALMFNHALNTLHDGDAVTEGTKFIMRGDILYTAFPEDVHLLPTINDSGSLSELCNRHWCSLTAAKHGTRNHIGEVWYCVCASDMHGANLDTFTRRNETCWHNFVDEKPPNKSNQLSRANPQKPKVLVLLSGKRASGKDYIANFLLSDLSEIGLSVHRTALGNINKKLYAAKVGIDVERLLNDRAFKESHRVAMIEHHSQRNAEDPEWCLKSVLNAASDADVMLLSDLRTRADLIWFQKQSIPIVLLRINATDSARHERGWKPCAVKDALHTETDLDCYNDWTACWDNSDNTEEGGLLLHDWTKLTVVPRIKAVVFE